MSHPGKGALLVGKQLAEQPDVAKAAAEGKVQVVERAKPVGPGDSGLIVYLESAPREDEGVELTSEDVVVCCLHCLLDQHPEAGAGLDLVKDAPEGTQAVLSDGEWELCSAS